MKSIKTVQTIIICNLCQESSLPMLNCFISNEVLVTQMFYKKKLTTVLNNNFLFVIYVSNILGKYTYDPSKKDKRIPSVFSS